MTLTRIAGAPAKSCWFAACRSFFFQAEDGIRDKLVTGVQTCALPISERSSWAAIGALQSWPWRVRPRALNGSRREYILFGQTRLGSSKEVFPVSEFDGKIVLVTGCARASGMGRAISVAFARAGADVVATDVAVGGTRNENEEGLVGIRLGWKGLGSPAGEIQGPGGPVLTPGGDRSRRPD